jgi:HAD superfamily hydrolase (TIGR01509 family)
VPVIQAVIFDMDGVLIESEPYHIRSEIDTFGRYGIALTEQIAGEYLGFKLDDYISALSFRFHKKLNHQAVKAELRDKIEIMYREEVPLVPGVAELLVTLSKTHKLGLATSQEKRLAKVVLKRLEIMNFFAGGTYKEDVKHGKPDPEVFLTTANLLETTPDRCVVVEDAEAGFAAGKRAGMYVVARKAAHNTHQKFANVDVIVDDLVGLLPVLRSLDDRAH